jgi:DNA-binding NarL/FixJ family response regulator
LLWHPTTLPSKPARALAAGASGLAVKSDSAEELVMTIESVGKNSAALSPAGVRLIQSQLAAARSTASESHILTSRERDVLKLLAAGMSSRELATKLAISAKTVQVHRANLMRKLELRTYRDLIQSAIRHKLIEV